jgi:hypothetical protein
LTVDRPLTPADGRVGWEMQVKNNHPTVTGTPELILVCAEPTGVKLGVTSSGIKRTGHIVLDTTFTHTLSVPTTGNAFFMECLKGVNLGIGFTTPETLGSSPPQLGTWFHRPVATGSQTLNPKVRTAAFLGGEAGASVLLQANCWKTNAGFSTPKPGTILLKLRY